MRTFPTIVLGIFVAFALLGVGIFATYTAYQKNAVGTVVIWGSVPKDSMQLVLEDIIRTDHAYEKVSYKFVLESSLIPDLVEAIAAGRGPDLVIFPAEETLSQGEKLLTIPYSEISRRDFQDTYIQAGEIFLGSAGLKGVPFIVDPLVMYWNRSMFVDAGVSNPPKYWDEVSDLSGRLTKKADNGSLIQSAVALGTWDNVSHAKLVLTTLINQLGNPIIERGDSGLQVALDGQTDTTKVPADSAVRFYTDFADPTKPVYSWNRSQPSSRDAFIAGKVGIYIGLASELGGLRAANPNLNFDIAAVPSARGAGGHVATNLLGLSIPRGSQNPDGALLTIQTLSSVQTQKILSSTLRLPSVRRDVSIVNSADPYSRVFEQAALSAFSFLDINPSATDAIFKRMVENVTSGKSKVTPAVQSATHELRALF